MASDGFAEFLRDQLGSLGHITLRRMFGKSGVFCDRLMLGMVADDRLYFRVDDQNRADFKEAQAFPPLNYEKRGSGIDLSFWRAPDRPFDERDELVAWARLALAAARRVRPDDSHRNFGAHHGGQAAAQRKNAAPSAAVARDARVQPVRVLPHSFSRRHSGSRYRPAR